MEKGANTNRKPFRELTKHEKLKVRKEAYKLWALSRRKKEHAVRALRRISKEINMEYEDLLKWKDRDKWNERIEKERATRKVTNDILDDGLQDIIGIQKEENKETIDSLIKNAEIPEKWKLFIMYYLQSYNARQAQLKAGYSEGASMAGYNILNDSRVKVIIDKCKKLTQEELHLTAMDILTEYKRIAFADMTDYVVFDGQKVTLKDSTQVDGRLITEIKQGRDGVTIKLADKMRAMEKLEKLFNIIPDPRLLLEMQKFELQKQLAEKATTGEGNTQVTIVNDLR